jgi:hypothetical protein
MEIYLFKAQIPSNYYFYSICIANKLGDNQGWNKIIKQYEISSFTSYLHHKYSV